MSRELRHCGLASLALLALGTACAPDFTFASRRLAAELPPPREEAIVQRSSWYDAARTRPRRTWSVKLRADGSEVPHGVDRWFFADGTPQHERGYLDGEPHGTWRTWWPNGKLHMESQWGTSEPVVMRWWHENGQLSSQGLARDGLKQGPWTFWNADGVRTQSGAYSAGQREGEWEMCDERGAVVERMRYHADVRVGGAPTAAKTDSSPR